MKTYLGYFFHIFQNYTEDKQYKLITAESREKAIEKFQAFLSENSEDGSLPPSCNFYVDEPII